jgi:copper chaperone
VNCCMIGAEGGQRSWRAEPLSEREVRMMPENATATTATYTVPGMSCEHCTRAVSEALSSISGVRSVEVDLETKLVKVEGDGLDDATLRAAIGEAGYEAQ